MKKIYIKPVTNVHKVLAQTILAQSGGVTTNSKLGNSYNGNDVSYTKEQTDWNVWGD